MDIRKFFKATGTTSLSKPKGETQAQQVAIAQPSNSELSPPKQWPNKKAKRAKVAPKSPEKIVSKIITKDEEIFSSPSPKITQKRRKITRVLRTIDSSSEDEIATKNSKFTQNSSPKKEEIDLPYWLKKQKENKPENKSSNKTQNILHTKTIEVDDYLKMLKPAKATVITSSSSDDEFSKSPQKKRNSVATNTSTKLAEKWKSSVNIGSKNANKRGKDDDYLVVSESLSETSDESAFEEEGEEDVIKSKQPTKANNSNKRATLHTQAKPTHSPKNKLGSPLKATTNSSTHTPPNKSNKPPTFTHLPLFDKKCVFTGVFTHYGREEIVDKAKENGASVTSAVSGRTDYLVYGNVLEDGRNVQEGSKYKKVLELKANKGPNNAPKLISEEEFISMISPLNSKGVHTHTPTQVIEPSPSNSTQTTPTEQNSLQNKVNKIPKPLPIEKITHTHTLTSSLWSEKYRPKEISEIIGNNEQIRKLTNWLKDWQDVCLHGNKKVASKPIFRPGQPFQSENVNARAALISGPPGIGKTTSARLIAKNCGYTPLEFNASDDRNKSTVENIADMATGGYTLSHTSLLHTCVIMDEVDGLSGGDRGGSQAILKMIEKSKCPIICICNDRMSTKVRSIANKSYDIRFTRPQKQTVVKCVCNIINKEGVQIEPNAVEMMCESVGNDLRQLLNSIQFMCQNSTHINYQDAKNELTRGIKDQQVMINTFDVCKQILTGSPNDKLNVPNIMDMFFVDYDLLPLLIEENYLNAIDKNFNTGNRLQNSKIFFEMANDFATSDIISRKLRQNQAWSLLPDMATFSALSPHVKCKHFNSFLPRPDFPRFFGKNSTINKSKRLLGELNIYISMHTTSTKSSLKESGYSDLLFYKSISPLIGTSDPKLASEKCISFMESYSIPRDLLMECMDCLKLKNQDNPMNEIDSKTKANFTRSYKNYISHNLLKSNTKSISKSMKHSYTDKVENEDEIDIEKSGNDENTSDNDDILILKKNVESSKNKPSKKARKK